MKTISLTRIGAMMLLCLLAGPAAAEDIDIFGQPPGVTVGAPNVLFILDNSANWSRQSQQWPGGITQGEAELLSIRNMLGNLGNLKKPLNVGIMMLTERGNIGGYVRFGVRPMLQDVSGTLQPSTANTALRSILLSISGGVNDPEEKVPQSKDNYTNAMYEAWLYLTNRNSWAGDAPKNGNDDGDKRDYSGNAASRTAAAQGLTSGFAYNASQRFARYNSPAGNGDCATTYIVFVGNNRASENGGMPAVPGKNDPAVTTLNTYSYSTPANGFIFSTWARFLFNRPDLGALGSPAALNGRVITYTIDAYNAQSNPTYTGMMRTTADAGGGKYYRANTTEELDAAFQSIVNEIQAVNSVFAAVSLPVSVNQRGTFLNQVYLGVFRPDRLAKPNWPGNLKHYKIGVSGSTLFLADKFEAVATSASTGFISPNVTSFWTTSSSFWDTTYYPASQGTGGASDAPDGDLVEKGGVAQGLRTTYATSHSARKVYTCTSGCTGGSSLSATPFATSNGSVTSALGTSDTTEQSNIVNWVRGENNMSDDNPGGTTTAVRGFLHGDVLHSRPAVVNYNRDANDVFVFYGSNDGMLHAVKGGQDPTDGDGVEQWAFIAPEHFGKFKRMRDHSPTISSSDRKPYFIDGSPTVYTEDVSNPKDGKITAAHGDKAYLFLSMRRGGRFIYGLNVSDPTDPKLLWTKKNTDAGFDEMAQTWSDLRVARIRASADPVLIFGLGYDAVGNDSVVAGVQTSGRGVMVINAVTGAKIWASSDQATAPVCAAAADRCGINYSISASVAPVDTDDDGLVDRIIAADTGGNIWRMNIDDANTSNWRVRKVASLASGSTVDARRFINAPDVVLAGQSEPNYDAILIGSGDREQPFDKTINNRFYMIKDTHAKDYLWTTPVTEADLYDTTDNLIQVGTGSEPATATAALNGASGWYIRLGAGEKVDGPSTTLSETTFFGTNTPADNTTDVCVSNLGTARAYAVDYRDARTKIDRNDDGTYSTAERAQVIPGGGFPPPPVAVQVQIDGQTYQAVAFGTQLFRPPGAAFGRRFRSWWYQPVDP